MSLLHSIKKRFRVQFAIVEAVEMEIRKSRKFRARFTKDLQKSLDNGTITVIDARSIPAFVSTSPLAVLDAIQTTGLENEEQGLDYGEAYTFAAGVALQVPVVSNDMSAIKTAVRKGIQLPRHLFRTFDLFVLCHQTGDLNGKICDSVRQKLFQEGEFLPEAFAKTSFDKGLPAFYARLNDGSMPSVGAQAPIHPLDVRLTIQPWQAG